MLLRIIRIFLKKKYFIFLTLLFFYNNSYSSSNFDYYSFINNLNSFWSSVWDYTNVKGVKIEKFKYSKEFIKNKFFVNSKLNFAENLLSKKHDSKAITFISENGYRTIRSWKSLNYNTSKLIHFFKKILENVDYK